jgi:hypothetical protein
VHYDTFGYVVLEALLNGLIVIVPHMSCFEELFGDAIAYVDVSDVVPKEKRYRWRHAVPELNSDDVLQRYVAKVQELEASESLRLSYIEKAMKLRDRYDNMLIGKEFAKYAHMEVMKLAKREKMDAELYNEYEPHHDVTHTILGIPNY